MLNHNYIGTEHILLALIHEGMGIAAKALESLGVTEEAARQQVEEIIGRGEQPRSAGTSRSYRGQRRHWSCRCARLSRSAITSSGASTSC